MSVLITLALLGLLSPGAVPPQGETVSFTSDDGFVLAGTYYAAIRDDKGPAVLLLHQCSGGSRRDFETLASLLARRGVHVLAFDFRGFGDSRNETFYDFHQQMDETEALWPMDVEAAYRSLLSRSGVDPSRSGVLGASCGSSQAVLLAKRHEEVGALVMLSGSLTDEADETYRDLRERATFCVYSEDDGYGTPESMRRTFARSTHAASELLVYKGSNHGAELLEQDPGLGNVIADWFTARLSGRARASRNSRRAHTNRVE